MTGKRSRLVVLVAFVALVAAACSSPAPPPGGGPVPTSAPPPVAAPTGEPSSNDTFPNADNTGWKHTGVTLTRATCQGDGTFPIDQPGAVIDSMLIPCSVRVNASNVTISRSMIVTGNIYGIYLGDEFKGLTVSDVEIDGSPGGCQAAIGFANFTVVRVNIHNCGDGLRIGTNSVLRDSWIHDFWHGLVDGKKVDDPHNDGAQATGGSNITIQHNRIDNPHSETSCILIGGEFGSPSNILIENNYLNGGNWTIYLDPKGTNRVIKDNVFTRNFVYGPGALQGQYQWTGNSYDDGKPLAE